MKIESSEEALLFLLFGESYLQFDDVKLDEVRTLVREKLKLLGEKGWSIQDNRAKVEPKDRTNYFLGIDK